MVATDMGKIWNSLIGLSANLICFSYQTANGISAEEAGGLRAVGPSTGTVAQGSYSYTSPEGKQISIQYVADENGFHAVGDAIPTSPPIPAAIARALAYIAAHPHPAEPKYIEKYYWRYSHVYKFRDLPTSHSFKMKNDIHWYFVTYVHINVFCFKRK